MADPSTTALDILNINIRPALKSHRSTMSDNSDFEERTSFAAYLLRNSRRETMLSCSCLTPDKKFCELADYPLGCVYAPENEQD